MSHWPKSSTFLLTICLVVVLEATASAQVRHPWLPPFGLDRIGTGSQETGIEADATARPDSIVNPVDLGTILVPHDWLLLKSGQSAQITLAAISHDGDETEAVARAWFSRQPELAKTTKISLAKGQRRQAELTVSSLPPKVDREDLRITIERPNGKVLWEKTIPTMLVQSPPVLPRFGAVATKLRYDGPISVRHETGQFSTMEYSKGWDDSLDDVVVCLPGGERFVFWRGSCYVPFWAGRHNTGLSYEWAETKPPADGFKDCVEPLMDKELRYGRVEIIESTPSRIHVRWTYQSCDFNYKVWGDSATEDFYFYPDGFGTRVLTLQSALDSDYELSEFIIMTPAGAYPFDVLPTNLVDIVFLDGERRELEFPYDPARQSAKLVSRDQTAIYRVRMHKQEEATAIYFHPQERKLPPVVFAGFIDQGQVVTPTYWGSHWPLGRGQTTGGAIDDRIQITPSHNSVMSWASQQPLPLAESRLTTLDTLGRTKPMRRQTWAWLIGLTSASDERLREWASSFSQPPALELSGARLGVESYSLERRAIGLVAESRQIRVKLKPENVCVNPVFEIAHASSKLVTVTIEDTVLPEDKWSWDGRTLWLDATVRGSTTLQFQFE